MCLPVLNDFGTDEQKRRFLAKNISGEHVWCQMFSEPGAGSDVASLQTKAELDGDEWVINGQKVWTTLAHVSDYGILIARTNPEAPKHAGISMFILDMKAPAWRSAPSTRSTVAGTSTRSSSPTCASRRTGSSAR